MKAVLARRVHVLLIKVMSTVVVAKDPLHAKIIQATLDKTVGKDETSFAKFYGHDLVLVFVLITIFSVITVYLLLTPAKKMIQKERV